MQSWNLCLADLLCRPSIRLMHWLSFVQQALAASADWPLSLQKGNTKGQGGEWQWGSGTLINCVILKIQCSTHKKQLEQPSMRGVSSFTSASRHCDEGRWHVEGVEKARIARARTQRLDGLGYGGAMG
eukprot:scaffold84049_cov23-Tisochrysis_lutea.AAC.1